MKTSETNNAKEANVNDQEGRIDDEMKLYEDLEINCKGERVNTASGDCVGWTRKNGSKVDAYRKDGARAIFIGTFDHEGAAAYALMSGN